MGNKLPVYKWTEIINSIYMMIMFLVFPLYYQNNYINMLEAKTTFFVLATVVYLAIGIVLIVLAKISGERALCSGRNAKCFLLQDIFFVIFVFSVVLATVLADNFYVVWNAPDCKLFGAKILFLCCGIYIIASRGYTFGKTIKISATVGIGIVCVLTVLNRYGIDPLDMSSNLVEYQKSNYLSTIGNINILSNFICIFVPLFMGLFLYAQRWSDKIAYSIMIYIGVMAGIATNSDSFFLGFGASITLLLWFSLTDNEIFKGYLKIIMICAMAPLSLKVFNQLSSYNYSWESLQLDLIYRIPWLLVAVAIAVILVVITKSKRAINWRRSRMIMLITLGICLLTVIFIIIRANAGATTISGSYFAFSDEWGTNRGYVWSRTCQLFNELPFYQQLTGIGPGYFDDFFATFNAERSVRGLPNFVDPHNEALYYLVSTGVLGLIGYFGMMISALIKCVKVSSKETIILAAVLVSWLAQGLVNNPLVFVTPYIFLFLGISRYEIKSRF